MIAWNGPPLRPGNPGPDSRGSAGQPEPESTSRGWILPRFAEVPDPRRPVTDSLRMSCRAGGLELDLLIRVDRTRIRIAGQIVQADAAYTPIAGVAVALVDAAGEAIVAETCTDEFGEFDFAGQRTEIYGLRIGADRNAPRVLVWTGD